MKISELRGIIGMTQRQFAQHFGIPVGTLRNWEQGIAYPPEYVFNMIFTSMRRDRMINIETMKFIKMLDRLATLTENGIEPFENATENTFEGKIFYDSRKSTDEKGYKVVCDACLVDDPECYHHDIVSFYGCDTNEYTVRVVFGDDEDDEEDRFEGIEVTMALSEDVIVIENGRWYFV